MTSMRDGPLPKGQQLFLQRLMSQHMLTDAKAKELHEELDESGLPMEHCFRIMNSRLTKDFALEIASVSTGGKRYHAIINQHADEVSKKSFLQKYNPHHRAFIRQVLERLVSSESAPRMDLINLRNDLKELFKLSIELAEQCIDQLIDERWLVLDSNESESRRQSMNVRISLSPRSYLELSTLLTEFGMPKEDLPQLIFHRI